MLKENLEIIMIAKILYYMMVVGFLGCSINSPTLKLKVIGLLLCVVNALIFWS